MSAISSGLIDSATHLPHIAVTLRGGGGSCKIRVDVFQPFRQLLFQVRQPGVHPARTEHADLDLRARMPQLVMQTFRERDDGVFTGVVGGEERPP